MSNYNRKEEFNKLSQKERNVFITITTIAALIAIGFTYTLFPLLFLGIGFILGIPITYGQAVAIYFVIDVLTFILKRIFEPKEKREERINETFKKVIGMVKGDE